MADEMKRLRLQMKKTVTLILFTLLSITAALAKDKYANATFKQGEVTSIQTREIARGGNGAWNVHNVPTYTITTDTVIYTVERGGHRMEGSPSLHVGETVQWFLDGGCLRISLDGKVQPFPIIGEQKR